MNMTPSDYAAWWGAIVATIVLLWDFKKWKMSEKDKSENQIKVEITPNVVNGDNRLSKEEQKKIFLKIENTTGSKISISEIDFYGYKSIFDRIKRNKIKIDSKISLPRPLDIGEFTHAHVRQIQNMDKCINSGFLYCRVKHSGKRKPVVVRVKNSK
jgi:aspartate carbamoyltransferase regulatory subunit